MGGNLRSPVNGIVSEDSETARDSFVSKWDDVMGGLGERVAADVSTGQDERWETAAPRSCTVVFELHDGSFVELPCPERTVADPDLFESYMRDSRAYLRDVGGGDWDEFAAYGVYADEIYGEIEY